MAFFNILSHPYLIVEGGGAYYTAQSSAKTVSKGDDLTVKEATKKKELKAAATYETKKQTSDDIITALNIINVSSMSTEFRAAAIEALANKYDRKIFTEIVAADAAVNGATAETLAYLATDAARMYVGVQMAVKRENAAAYQIKTADPKLVEIVKTLKEEKAKESGDVIVTDIDATLELSNKEALSLTRQTHQCILTHYLEPVAAHHRRYMTNTFCAANYAPTSVSAHGFAHPAKIILVDDTSSDSSVAPINALTSLGKTDIDPITPAQLARLMPALRLYKVYREGGVEVAKVEYKFSNSTDRGFLTNASPSITTGDFVMDAGYAKGRSAGIKSFNWSFIGGDPFTATRDLKATLKLFFQDFRDLTKVRTDSKNLFANADAAAANPEYKYLDLIVQPDCRETYYKKKTKESTEAVPESVEKSYKGFNPECYEVAVEVGYAPSPDLPEGLKNQTDTIYLTMVEHSFDIGQDGTFELTIDYRARLANLLGDKGMNILAPAGGHMVENSFGKKYLTYDIREVEELIEAENKKSKDDEGYESEDLEALKSVKNHLLYLRNTSLYRSISNTLMRNELIYRMSVPIETFARFSNFDKFDRDKNQLIGLDVRSLWEPTKEDIVSIAGTSSTESAAGAEGLENTTIFLADTGERAGALDKNTSGRAASTRGVAFKEDIYFTTVGNLLAVALEHVLGEGTFVNQAAAGDIKELTSIFKAAQAEDATEDETAAAEATKGPAAGAIPQGELEEKTKSVQAVPVKINTNQAEILKRFRVILGAVTYIDAVSGSEKTINLAHLPVSTQMFRKFMIDKVISQNKSFYSLQDFLKDILTDIVFDSLNRICFGGYTADDSSVTAGISLFTGQGVQPPGPFAPDNWQEPISSNTGKGIYEIPKGRKFKMLNTSLATRASPIFTNTKTNKAKEFSYLMFSAFSSHVLNSRLHGDKEEDADKGIAHFRYGSTTGMMKSVKFTKSPIEYLAEERYVREGSDNLLNQLAGRYNMEMSMVGNNMFIPGQYVYFDPVALGIGKTFVRSGAGRSLANLMGLGGYHIVTEVGCSITPGKFETTVKGLWETGGSMPQEKGKK